MKAQSALFTLPHYNPETPRGFDALEVHTVAEGVDSVEQLASGEETPDDANVFFSLYGHTPNEGCECVGDFTSFDAACEFAVRLGGVPV